MSDISANNKRIAKNTLLLYFRTILVMGISLYTSRVVLATLGVEDFGIYNVVGGVVAMFGIISGSLSSAISRFITFELGRGDKEKLKRIFSTSVNIQLGLSLIIILLGETIGLWFLNYKMNIPAERMHAANWVLHCSLLTFAINLVSIPYNAAIIAHERMSVFAYVSLLEASLKLTITYMLYISLWDKLITYSVLLVVVAACIRLVYGIYCNRHFEEAKYIPVHDHRLIRDMAKFAGWNFIGATSCIMRDHGGNIVLNLFCGPTVNAARGIASQVNGVIQNFITNFTIALNPQITKSYATGDHAYMMLLIFQGSRLSFYMLLLLSLPVLVSTPYLLSLWLGTVPEHTVQFVRLILVFSLCESMSKPLITAMLATGKIRNYQILVGGLQMLNLPISYLMLRTGGVPETVMLVAICMSQCCLIARLIMLKRMIGLSIKKYLGQVCFNAGVVLLLCLIIPIATHRYLKANFLSFLSITIIVIINTIAVIYFVGLSTNERKVVHNQIKKAFNKTINHG